MRYVARSLLLGLAVGLGLCVASLIRAEEEDEVAVARKVVFELAKEVESGKDITKKAAGLREKYPELGTLKAVYKPRIGSHGEDQIPETIGVEVYLIRLSKHPFSRAALKKESAKVLRVGYVNLAVVEITRFYSPEECSGDRKKRWDRCNAEVRERSQDLIRAVQDSDPKAVQRAASRINSSCTKCHSTFRD
jgi:hypothetical protein